MKILTIDELKTFLEKVDDNPALVYPIKEPELKDLADIYACCQAHQEELKGEPYQRSIHILTDGLRIAKEYGLNPNRDADVRAYKAYNEREG